MTRPTRWITDNGAEHSQRYIERFRRLSSEGADLAGEARLVDAMIPRASTVLDAGCGPGRVGAELAARGHEVTGVDADAQLIAAAREDHPGPRWIVADLAELDLSADGGPDQFDAAVMAGNVMLFVAEGTEERVLRRVAAHLRPGGPARVRLAAGRGEQPPPFARPAAGAARIGSFSAAHDISGGQAWVTSLLLMAFGEVIVRLAIIFARGRVLSSRSARHEALSWEPSLGSRS